jgi:hypothetical protein
MFTNNYINYKYATFMNESSFNYKDISGTERQSSFGSYNDYYSDIGSYIFLGHAGEPPLSVNTATTSGYHTVGGVYFGSGATLPTKDDYCLESPISSDAIKVSSMSKTILKQENGQYLFIGEFIVRNISDSAINIQELGCFSQPFYSRSSTGSQTVYYLSLMERTVLDEPITIPAGESRLVAYKLVFNQP